MARDISRGVDPSMQYLSNRFQGNSTDSTIAAILGQDTPKKKQFCAECGKPIDDGYKNDPDSPDAYCREDYQKLFGTNKCEGCNQAIFGPFVTSMGKKYHQQCFSEDVPCDGCGQRLFGEILEACGRKWHPKCFKCYECKKGLSNSQFKSMGKTPYCVDCYNNPQLSEKRTQVVVKKDESAKKTVEAKQLQQEIQQNLQKGKTFCAECGEVIGGLMPSVNWKGSVFHDFCLSCAACKGDLDDGVKEVDGLPYCKKCGGGSANAGFCGGCGKKISGTFVNAMGSKWHKECFVCTSCKGGFGGGYAVVNELPYCASCSQKVASKAPSTSMNVGERKQGFTVDPRTGAKKFT